MCDDIEGELARLAGRGVEISRPVSDLGWGRIASIRLPGGSELPIYEPRHPVAHGPDG
jgi:predicted enzyme related to lactoylglutathione lyase